jgi:hypothetical protein
MFYIKLHQATGEIQTPFQSESREEITQLWAQECAVDDEYTDFDVLLTLSFRDVVFDSYLIPASQQNN